MWFSQEDKLSSLLILFKTAEIPLQTLSLLHRGTVVCSSYPVIAWSHLHYQCCHISLSKMHGPRIIFRFMLCSICEGRAAVHYNDPLIFCPSILSSLVVHSIMINLFLLYRTNPWLILVSQVWPLMM